MELSLPSILYLFHYRFPPGTSAETLVGALFSW